MLTPNRASTCRGLNSPVALQFTAGLSIGLIVGAAVVGLWIFPGTSAAIGSTAEPRLLIDNDKIRVSRLVLEPGQSTPKHTHEFQELAICLRGGKLRTTIPGPEPQGETHYPRAGQVFMPNVQGVTHILTNTGTSPYEQITVELKE